MDDPGGVGGVGLADGDVAPGNLEPVLPGSREVLRGVHDRGRALHLGSRGRQRAQERDQRVGMDRAREVVQAAARVVQLGLERVEGGTVELQPRGGGLGGGRVRGGAEDADVVDKREVTDDGYDRDDGDQAGGDAQAGQEPPVAAPPGPVPATVLAGCARTGRVGVGRVGRASAIGVSRVGCGRPPGVERVGSRCVGVGQVGGHDCGTAITTNRGAVCS